MNSLILKFIKCLNFTCVRGYFYHLLLVSIDIDKLIRTGKFYFMQIDEILECYLINANCTLFNRLLNSKSRLFAEGPLSTYVGTQQVDDIYKPLVLRTKHLMALVSGHPVVDLNRTSCFGNETDEVMDDTFSFYFRLNPVPLLSYL